MGRVLDLSERLCQKFHAENNTNPTAFICNKKTLNALIDEIKEECTGFTKPNKVMIGEGVRYKSILYQISPMIEDGIILIR